MEKNAFSLGVRTNVEVILDSELALQFIGERRALLEVELEVLEALQVAHAAAERAEVAERRAPENTLTNI